MTKQDMVGYWPLRGDVRDHSGMGRHGILHGAGAENGRFDGRSTWIEIPAAVAPAFGAGDFTLCARIMAEDPVEDVPGDVLGRFDPVSRTGLNLSVTASAGGYNGRGDSRNLAFGIDNGQMSAWRDCGRPSATSNYVSNSLTVFDGHLYAAITDAEREEDWCHVFRYAGGATWVDCGRVGDRRTHGVGPMVVHDDALYAGTWTYDWTRVGLDEPLDDFCAVYRYAGGTTWVDCGQPGACRRLFGLASYRGSLYVTAEDGHCYVYEGDRSWAVCGRFPNYAHPLGVHDGRLYAGVLNPAGVWAYDGQEWTALGNPLGAEERCDQVHALQVYGGRLHATTWPEGHVVRLEADGAWTDCGWLGDSMEINALVSYNGMFYAGSIPRAEVFRFDGMGRWTSVGRFLEPADRAFANSNEWCRVTSLTVFDGKLFGSLGSCTSSRLDAPADLRGRVYALEAGKVVTYDRDIGSGWHHVAAVRRANRLALWLDGRKVCESEAFDGTLFDLTNARPLLIGSGPTDCFSGRIQEVRAYDRALTAAEIGRLNDEIGRLNAEI